MNQIGMDKPSSQNVAPYERSSQPISSPGNGDARLLDTMRQLSLTTPPEQDETTSTAGNAPSRATVAKVTTPGSARDRPRRTSSSSTTTALTQNNAFGVSRRASSSSLKDVPKPASPKSPVMRRSSSSIMSSPASPSRTRSNQTTSATETQQPDNSAAKIAFDFLKQDMIINHQHAGDEAISETVVILQDDCYGHRYARPRTSKASLNSIVERPERINASILGLSTAYVFLGERHMDGGAAPHPRRPVTSLPRIPFKIHKTARKESLRSPSATAVHGARWMEELTTMCNRAEEKLAMGAKELLRPETPTFSSADETQPRPAFHEGDLYLCSGSLNALEGALGGVCEAVDLVFDKKPIKRAFVCIRPPGHHCSADMPSGFCWLNNVHVGINYAAMAHGLTHAAIIDFDLHHGDGSQALTWSHNSKVSRLPKNTPIAKKTQVGYFSLHDINSYPCELGDDEKVRNASLCIENAHGQSIWNVHLHSWKSEAEFWRLYETRYLVLLEKARTFLRNYSERLRQTTAQTKAKAAIFISAGFDASEWESPFMQRHQVNVPTTFFARFTNDVIKMSLEEDLGVEGRVISVLEGGYSDRALMSGVLSHLCGLTGSMPKIPSQPATGSSYDPVWWSLPYLEEVERPNTLQPSKQPKKQRNDFKPTYTSATESYKAKVVVPPPGRRSLSGSLLNQPIAESGVPRPPTPPPEDVPWSVAALELSKVLTPTDRETRSCKPEELNAEASRARRDRLSGNTLPFEPLAESKKMQLREKRVKQPSPSGDENKKPPSRASRRKTVADVKLLSSGLEDTPQKVGVSNAENPRMPTRRRSSLASSTISTTTDLTSGLSSPPLMDTTNKAELVVPKKPRAAPSHPKDTTSAKMTKRPKPPSRRSSVNIESGDATQSSQTAQVTAPSPRADTATGASTEKPELDGLMTGMKKMSLKLNVPPKEEYEARQTKTKAAPRGRPPKDPSSKNSRSLSPPKPKARRSSPSKAKAKPAGRDANAGVAVKVGKAPNLEDKAHVGEEPSLPKYESQAVRPDVPDNAQTANFVLGNPGGAGAGGAKVGSTEQTSLPVAAKAKHEPFDMSTLPPLPPSSSPAAAAPSPPGTVRRTKKDLPVFTSSSPISFGTKPGGPHAPPPTMFSAPDNSGAKGTGDPFKLSTNPTSGPIVNGEYKAPGSQELVLDQISGQAPPGNTKRTSPVQARSIWDIPDTPQPARKP